MSNYKDKVKEKETRAKWYQDHKDEVIARAKKWNDEHREEINARRRKNKNETV